MAMDMETADAPLPLPKTPAPPPKLPRTTEDAAYDSHDAGAKYRRYEKEYLRRINHKYFSGATPSGEPVFESSTVIDGFVFKESKDPPLKKFTEGPSIVEDHGKAGASNNDAVPTSSGRKSIIRKS